MKIWPWPLIGALFLLSALAHGEGGCPAGMIPASGTDINSCVPIPSGYNRQQPPARAPLPVIWVDRWGAVATDSSRGVLGVATDMVSKDDAERAALSDCAAKGGTQCKEQTWYRNACAVMVLGNAGFNVGNAATIAEATQLGMNTCTNSKDTNCHVYYSGCSLPIRTQ